jgi:D-alanyl-D-alanine carboxypeptidase/D-alanyl-D-alanine-endopeptidase (penicillin-binding protein 4)
MHKSLLSTLLVIALMIAPVPASIGQSTKTTTRSTAVAASATGGLTASDSAAALAKLESDLRKLVTLTTEISQRSVGIKVVSLMSRKNVFDLNGDKPLTPASTTKLLTAYSALLLFGADYEIPTIAFASSRPKEGVLKGDLIIRGHGDPLLSTVDIDELVAKLATSGIKKIEGNIVADGSYFDADYERLSYSGDADVVVDLPPVCGLSIEGNVVTVVVSSSRQSGQLCTVQTFPPSSGFAISNTAVSGGGGKKKRTSYNEGTPVAPEFSVERYGDEEVIARRGGARDENAGGPTIKLTTDENGRQSISVSGTLAPNQTVSRQFEIANPPMIVAGMVRDRLLTRGITIDGTVTMGATPAKAAAIAQVERPLSEVLHPVLKDSHNHYAEFLFKMIGGATAPSTGSASTAEQARLAVTQCMAAAECEFGNCKMNDGSGLSRRNLISPDALVAALSSAYNNPLIFSALYESMSIAGIDGTLRKRMKGSRAAGNVHGKTGTLRNVSALTGYVTTADGEVMAFAMLMNGGNIGAYKDVQNNIAMRIARFSYTEKSSVDTTKKRK